MLDVYIVFVSSFLTTTGFILRYFWERHIQYQNKIKNEKLDNLTNKLEMFYYPLYFNLERLTNLWSIAQSHDIDEECLSIHTENQNIIKTNIARAKPIPALFNEIMKYDKHVTILKVLKHNDIKPRKFDAAYPENFKKIIKIRIDSLENNIVK